MSWVFKTGCAIAVATVATSVSSSGRAADIEVSGDVAAQGYEVASPWGDIVLGKRRLTTSLGLAAYNLQGDSLPFEGNYSIMMRMRVDNDFGVDAAERSFDAGDPTRFVPGMDYPPVDLMYGYVEGRDIGDGWFGFRVGRQYVTDVLGWWSFDGAMLRLTTPFYLQAEVYGGLEQRAGAPLSTGRFESQGVWRGNHRGIRDRASDYPSYQFTGQAPAIGAALESTGFSYLHVRWTWRRVYNTAPAFTRQFPAPAGGGLPEAEGMRLSSERFGGAATAYLSDVGSIRAGFAYDFYSQFVNRGYAGIEFYPIANKLVLGIDGEYFRPTFDADSIWNWFTHNPVVDVLGRIAGRPVDGLELSASGGARLWAADGDPANWAEAECSQTAGDAQELQRCLDFGADPSLGSDGGFARDDANRGTSFAPDILANAGLSYRWGTGSFGVNGRVQNGVGGAASNRGRSGGGAVDAQQAIVNDVFFVGGRVSAFSWSDPLRKDRDATSFGYVLAPEYRPHRVARMRFEWEHNINRLVGQRFRVLGLVSFRVEP